MATKKKDDVFAMTAFDPSKLADSIRDFTEKGAEQSRDAFARLKTTAEDAAKTVEATVETAQAGTVELGLKAIGALRANTESSLTHMEELLGVKSMSDFIELQTAFVRKQTEATVEHAKSMQEATRKLAESVVRPGKEAAEKAFAAFKTV